MTEFVELQNGGRMLLTRAEGEVYAVLVGPRAEEDPWHEVVTTERLTKRDLSRLARMFAQAHDAMKE